MTPQASTDAVILSRYRAGEDISMLSIIYGMTFKNTVLAMLRAQHEETKEACAKEIRLKCGVCLGTGNGEMRYDDEAGRLDECEFCGRPIQAIRALSIEAGKDTP